MAHRSSLRSALKGGKPVADAAARAKQVASFNGEMRDVASELMDHFRLNDVFGIEKSAMLFDEMAHRTHYTSVLRYPVLEWKTVTKKGRKISGWFNYGGDDKIFTRPFMRKMIEEKLVPELQLFPNAWLVPFGPTPAFVLDELVRKGVIGGDRILAGLNHPSGSQWNRHNCQMDRVDHNTCSPNVGCAKVQERTNRLKRTVAKLLTSENASALISD